jgi:hypothetical protein
MKVDLLPLPPQLVQASCHVDECVPPMIKERLKQELAYLKNAKNVARKLSTI